MHFTYTVKLLFIVNIISFVSSCNVTNSDPDVIVIYKDNDEDKSLFHKDIDKALLYFIVSLLCLIPICMVISLCLCFCENCNLCYCNYYNCYNCCSCLDYYLCCKYCNSTDTQYDLPVQTSSNTPDNMV